MKRPSKRKRTTKDKKDSPWNKQNIGILQSLLRIYGEHSVDKIAAELRDQHNLNVQDEQVRARIRREKVNWYDAWLKTGEEIDNDSDDDGNGDDSATMACATNEELSGSSDAATTMEDVTLENADLVQNLVMAAESPEIISTADFTYVVFPKAPRRDIDMKVVNVNGSEYLQITVSVNAMTEEDKAQLTGGAPVEGRIKPSPRRSLCKLPATCVGAAKATKVNHRNLQGLAFVTKEIYHPDHHTQVSFRNSSRTKMLGNVYGASYFASEV
jgi:hypothetical protein